MHDKKVVFQSPLTSRSGYGERARELAKMLCEIYPDNLGLLCEDMWGSTKKIHQVPKELREYLVKHEGEPKVWIHHAVPDDFRWNIGEFNIGITAGPEVDVAPGSWLKYANGLDLLLVSSNWSKNIFQSSKNGDVSLETETEVLNETFSSLLVKEDFKSTELKQELDSVVTEDQTFLSVAEWGAKDLGESRKAIPELIYMYESIFKGIENRPGLILKLDGYNRSTVEHYDMQSRVESLAETTNGSIYILTGELSEADMASLFRYKKNIGYLGLSRGEGFGRPMLEAAASGLSVIATGVTGQLDFLNPASSVLIGASKTPYPSKIGPYYMSNSNWFEPDWELASQIILDVWQNPTKYKTRMESDTKAVRNNFDYKSTLNNFIKILKEYGKYNI